MDHSLFDIFQVECVQRTMIIISTPSMCEQAGKNIMENCLSVVVTALSMVSHNNNNQESGLNMSYKPLFKIANFLVKN